jgi:uncharacterized protein (DUF433 family)
MVGVWRHSAIFGGMKAGEFKDVIQSDPEAMGGTSVFERTRVPLQNLIDYREGGESIEDFLDTFPSVPHEHVVAVIEARRRPISTKV